MKGSGRLIASVRHPDINLDLAVGTMQRKNPEGGERGELEHGRSRKVGIRPDLSTLTSVQGQTESAAARRNSGLQSG